MCIRDSVYPVDRNIKTTFLRLWRKMGFIKKIKLLFNLIFSFVDDSDSELTENDLEQLKTQDMLEAALGELGDEYPEVKRYLVDERDIYLSQKIKNAPGNTVVAIVGAAHKSGVINNIKMCIRDSLHTLLPFFRYRLQNKRKDILCQTACLL